MAKVIVIVVVHSAVLAICSVSGDNEFRTYSVTDIYEGTSSADDTCYGTISMYNDWIFAGQIVYNIDDIINPACKQFELTIYADYPSNLEPLRIMARVIMAGSGDNEIISNETFSLDIYDDTHLNESIGIFENSGHLTTRYFVTSKEVLKLKFQPKMEINWSLIFTSFHTGLCHSYEYMCSNKRCIFHTLSCNRYDLCGDQSGCSVSPEAYATIAFGGLCALGVIFVIIYIIVKNRKTSDWGSWSRQPRTFSPAKAIQSVQAFTPATFNITPKRRWSYKY